MTLYRERLLPGPVLFLSLLMIVPASLLVFLPINFAVGIAVAIVFYVGSAIAFVAASPTIEITTTHFRAGRASLPIDAIGQVRGFRGTEATAQRGPQLDARAWLLIRGWIDPIVTIEVTDPTDPVPYWLISTRRPEKIIAVLAGTEQKSSDHPVEID